MTDGPKLRLGPSLLPGVLAVALFGLMALVVLNTPFEPMADGGFPGVESITAGIGYALFNLEALQEANGVPGTELFLAAFFLVALALDAALDASLVLAKREEDGEPVSALGSTSPGDTAAPDSSGFSRSEPTVTDGGSADTETESTGDTATTETESADGAADTESVGGEDR
ncbi:hypothetical protein [Natronorubrum halophilum]|uniref:hypothetical protein n=1 Tax=Natronorubrum halophilum TaxID=1702106 RepID=UPI0010C2375E|nr:hypothetical protein [Natronorubrum halophilum]